MTLAVRPDALGSAAAPPRLAAEVFDVAALRESGPAYDALLDGALHPNPFHGRFVVEAHAAAGLLPERLRFVAARDGGRLEALLPFMPDGTFLGFRRAHRAWTPLHFSVDGTPLLTAVGAVALADAMAAAGPLWRLPLVAVDGPAGRALLAAFAERGFSTAVLSSFDRAVLEHRGGRYEAYARRHLSRNRRKALARQWRRLHEAGRVAVASFADGEGLRRAVDAFLALEARGWKGRRGTALASRAGSATLARALFISSEGPVRSRADVLTLDGRPIAASLALLCGGTAFLLKTAHDEALRELSPGVLLEDAILRAFLDEGFAEKLDSASLPGGVLDGLYADRERIADLAVATDPGISPAALEAMAARERRRTAAMAVLKGWYWRAMDWTHASRPSRPASNRSRRNRA
jgi:CelD/BcsL family acetyltransferase involved in cellulose biosynthesis